MNTINGAVLLIAAAIALGLTVELLKRSRRANPDRKPAPIVTDRRRPCDTTGCGMPGWIVTRYRNGDTAHVCAGCLSEGVVKGWWAA